MRFRETTFSSEGRLLKCSRQFLRLLESGSTAAISRCIVAMSMGLLLGACASTFYAQTPTGTFIGKLTVEWIEPNLFVYRPDKNVPLVYTTSDGRRIQPPIMYTDAGSIPRLFWSAPGFGPWDFAPGYIIHDWLFLQHHCKEGDWQLYDFNRSATILAEAMKTQMVKAGKSEPTIVWAVYEAVSSDIARNLWDTGSCKHVSASTTPAPAVGKKPLVIKVIDFQ